jgi:hypothetical protein
MGSSTSQQLYRPPWHVTGITLLFTVEMEDKFRLFLPCGEKEMVHRCEKEI